MAQLVEPVLSSLRERKKREARSAIRESALELFIASGYDNVSVDQIAREADVSRATFFNYFPTKESVVMQPDPLITAEWLAIRQRCRPGASLWPMITEVLVESMRVAPEWITALKRLCDASPELALRMYGAGLPYIDELRLWLDQVVPARQRPTAHLQLNCAHSAVSTAFQQWDVNTPYSRFNRLVSAYLAKLGQGFS